MIDLVLSTYDSIPEGWASVPGQPGIDFAEDGLLQGGRVSRTPDVPGSTSLDLSSAPPISSDIGGILPTQTPIGDYLLCTRIDPGGVVPETNEDNNICCLPVQVANPIN